MSETVTPLAALQQHLTEKFPEYANLLAEFPPRESDRKLLSAGHLSEAELLAQDEHEFVAGQFIWTGIDYLGESRSWPTRGFYSGLLDLAGNVKRPLSAEGASLKVRAGAKEIVTVFCRLAAP